MKYPLWLLIEELKFMWRYKSKKHKPKSPIGQYNTIKIFNFGFENYQYRSGRYVRVRK